MADQDGRPGPIVDWSDRRLVTERALVSLGVGATVRIGSRTIVTPAAVDAAKKRQVEFARPQVGEIRPRNEDPAPNLVPGSRIAIGCDHGGFEMKQTVADAVRSLGYTIQDLGCRTPDPVDYPDIAERVAIMVAAGAASRGILLDGAGIGSCMVANKVPGGRAALAYDLSTCRNAREHNDANVLTLGARLLGPALVSDLVKCFLETPFAGGRHQSRVDKITAVEERMGRTE